MKSFIIILLVSIAANLVAQDNVIIYDYEDNYTPTTTDIYFSGEEVFTYVPEHETYYYIGVIDSVNVHTYNFTRVLATDSTSASIIYTNWYFVYDGNGEWKIYSDYTLIAYGYPTEEDDWYRLEYIDYSHLDFNNPENWEYLSRL